MNTIPTELVNDDKNTDVVHEGDEGLVEMGAVSVETRGGPFGPFPEYSGFTFT